MDREAFFAVSIAVLVIAVVLSVLGLIASRLVRRASGQVVNRIVATRAGVLFSLVIFGLWLLVMCWAELHPDHWLHRQLAQPFGVLFSGVIMALAFVLLANLLEACGIPLFSWSDRGAKGERERQH